MGVAFALSLFGAKMLCDKGIQTHVGTVRILAADNMETSSIPFIGTFVDWYDYFFSINRRPKKRTVLVRRDNSTIHLVYAQDVNYKIYDTQYVYATGQYDSCSMTLKPSTQADVELY